MSEVAETIDQAVISNQTFQYVIGLKTLIVHSSDSRLDENMLMDIQEKVDNVQFLDTKGENIYLEVLGRAFRAVYVTDAAIFALGSDRWLQFQRVLGRSLAATGGRIVRVEK